MIEPFIGIRLHRDILAHFVVEEPVLGDDKAFVETNLPYRLFGIDGAPDIVVLAAGGIGNYRVFVAEHCYFAISRNFIRSGRIEITAAGAIGVVFERVFHQSFVHIGLYKIIGIDKADVFARRHIESGVSRGRRAVVLLMYHPDAPIALCP